MVRTLCAPGRHSTQKRGFGAPRQAARSCRGSGRVGRRGGRRWRCLRRGFPVESAAADAELFALLRRGVEEAGKPGEGNAEGSSVAEVYPHAVGVEADLGWVNGDLSLHGRRPTVYDSGRASDCGGTAVQLIARCRVQTTACGFAVRRSPRGAAATSFPAAPRQLSSLTASG